MDNSLFIEEPTGRTDEGPGFEIIDVLGKTEIHSFKTRATTQQ
jgi:hypothetical protein